MNPKRAADKLLRDAGFVDIERPNGQLVGADRLGRGRYKVARPDQEGYSVAALQWMHGREWESEDDRAVWEMYAEGASYREISLAMGWGKTDAGDKARVFNIIKPLREAMTADLKPRRKAGRPADPESRGRDAAIIQYRLNARETNALHFLASEAGLSLADTARRAFMLVSRLVLEERLPVTALKHDSLGKISAVKE